MAYRRFSSREYSVLSFGLIFLVIDTLVRLAITVLPRQFTNWVYQGTQTLYTTMYPDQIDQSHYRERANRIRTAPNFRDLCSIWGYKLEEHDVPTKDGHLLGLHRLCIPKTAPSMHTPIETRTNKPVVYLHHGLFMNSEVWVCLTSPGRALPFALVDLGFDVWLGNNRGNKYSKKSAKYASNLQEFWNNLASDEFARHDIPDSISYILSITEARSIGCISFSQGSAQGFAALSANPQLDQKVNVFIALAPTMSPPGLTVLVVSGLMKILCVKFTIPRKPNSSA